MPVQDLTNESWRKAISQYNELVFTGWGQTNICEDAFKMARQREDLDSLNGMRMVSAYYSAISEMGAIALHQRQEIKP